MGLPVLFRAAELECCCCCWTDDDTEEVVLAPMSLVSVPARCGGGCFVLLSTEESTDSLADCWEEGEEENSAPSTDSPTEGDCLTAAS